MNKYIKQQNAAMAREPLLRPDPILKHKGGCFGNIHPGRSGDCMRCGEKVGTRPYS